MRAVVAPMRKTRVLIADDSPAIRALLRTLIEQTAGFEVVGAAPNGAIAVEMAGKLAPDAVVLDVEMPVMDGLAALRSIKKRHPETVVIMFSTLTDRGARITLDALAAGASDYVCKPVGKSPTASMAQVQDALVTRLSNLCRPARPFAPRSTLSLLSTVPTAPTVPVGRIEIVVVGVSTGGPAALARVLPALPAGLPVPVVVVVQHMPSSFTRRLAGKLDSECDLRVVEAQEGMAFSPGRIYIAPGDRHLTVAAAVGRPVARLVDSPLENGCRPAADPLFRSAAQVYGGATLAVVMTGMGSDGAEGARAVRDAGGQVWAQDEASSLVWGMPGAVVRANLAHRVLAIEAVAKEITAAAQRRVVSQKGRGEA